MSITIFSTSNTYWKITTGALAIASTILSSLGKHLSPGERAHIHCTIVRDYMSLMQELNMIQHTENEDDIAKSISHVREQLHRLYDIQPEPSRFAIAQFEKKYKKGIEDAISDSFEDMVMKNATTIQNRISLSLQKKVSSTSQAPTIVVNTL